VPLLVAIPFRRFLMSFFADDKVNPPVRG